jgi:hypothetical protein
MNILFNLPRSKSIHSTEFGTSIYRNSLEGVSRKNLEFTDKEALAKIKFEQQKFQISMEILCRLNLIVEKCWKIYDGEAWGGFSNSI